VVPAAGAVAAYVVTLKVVTPAGRSLVGDESPRQPERLAATAMQSTARRAVGRGEDRIIKGLLGAQVQPSIDAGIADRRRTG
jgi:hypothetical protein